MWDDIWQFVGDRIPTVGLIAVIVMIGAAREVWVWGYIYRRQVSETLYWRDRFFGALGLGEDLAQVASSFAEDPDE